MAASDIRPEGTDTLIDDGTSAALEREDLGGASGATGGDATSSRADQGPARGAFAAFKDAALSGTADLRNQAGDRARDYAAQGKDRTSDLLGNIARMVQDAAGTVEEKVGPDYAGYARQAADAVNGAAEGLRSKSVDELLEDAKGYVRSSPALAIGLAAALGFVVARVARAGVGEAGGQPRTDA